MKMSDRPKRVASFAVKWDRIGMLILGLVLGILLIEIGFRLAFELLPFSIQRRTSGVRLYGLYGPSLASLAKDFYQYCAGDERLFSRLLPDLVDVPVHLGPSVFHISTSSLGYENIGFRVSNSSKPWNGVVVGDSFTFCQGVEMQHCWVQQLAEKTDLSLANLGMYGTGSVSHHRYLQDYGWALDPELVIWQFWPNDPIDDYNHIIDGKQGCPRAQSNETEEEKPFGGLRDWLSQTFVTYNMVVAPALRALFPQLAGESPSLTGQGEQTSTTNGKLLSVSTERPSLNDPKRLKGMELTEEAIIAAAREAIDHDSVFLLMLAPSNLQVYVDYLASDRLVADAQVQDITMDQLIAIARANNIRHFDLRPILREAAARGDDLYFTYDLHWSPVGNRLVANALGEWLRETSNEVDNGFKKK